MIPATRKVLLGAALLIVAACSGKSTEQFIAQAEQLLAEKEYTGAVIELKNALQQDANSAQARWLLGKTYIEMGDTQSAEKELQHAGKLGWNPNDVRPALARVFAAQHKFAEIEALDAEGLEPPAASRLISSQAMAELARGETGKAAVLIEVANELQPESIAVIMAEANLMLSQGDYTGALITLEDVLSREPENGLAWSLKGRILTDQQHFEEARAAYDQSIALVYNNFLDRMNRALINLQMRDYSAAQADVDLLLKTAPDNPATNFLQGLLYFKDRQYEEAISALSLAEPASQRFPLILYYLGQAHLMEGNRDQAANFANKFYVVAPNYAPGRKLLALVRLQQGKLADVQELMQPVLDNKPDDVGALSVMANALLRDGKTDEGVSLLAEVARLQPDSSIAQIRLGAGLLMTGQMDQAARHIEAALDINPEFQQADILLVLNYVQKRDFEAAIEAAQAYQTRHPAEVTPSNLLGRVYLANGQLEEAKKSFTVTLSLDPGDPSANHHLAQIALAGGDLAAARNHYETVLGAHENSLSALLQLAILDARERKQDALVSRLEQAMEAHPTALQPRLMLGRYYLSSGKGALVAPLFADLGDLQKRSPEVLQLQALAQLSASQHSQASQTLEQLIQASPTPSSHHLLAMAAAGSGDAARTKLQLQRALSLDENYGPSLMALARIQFVDNESAEFQHSYDKLLKMASEHPKVLQLRAAVANRDGDIDGAVELASRAYDTEPSTEAMLALANYYTAAGDRPLADKLREQWAVDHPADIAAREALAMQLQGEGKFGQSIAQYEAILQIDPDNVMALNNLAWNLRLKEPAAAQKYIDRANDLAPERSDVLDTLAVIEHLNGENQRARRTILRALASRPDDRSMLYHSAMIEAALGEKQSAAATLEKILEGDDTNFSEYAAAQVLLQTLSE